MTFDEETTALFDSALAEFCTARGIDYTALPTDAHIAMRELLHIGQTYGYSVADGIKQQLIDGIPPGSRVAAPGLPVRDPCNRCHYVGDQPRNPVLTR
ncbi:hypothetical protein [Kutzneria albida]|uniref:Uncharacterized protein n=1 Tax=Kutzneria albida DSM 43870 TaxID=1449976 RepID=W5WCG9_9PSEU|nr:hypothetical protein [Kutzneria albida]AHH98221.1 hypothetical protein KALB_4859 [Kutzneria albida DSM 43870]